MTEERKDTMPEDQFVEARFATDLVPGPMEYAVLLPAAYGATEGPLSLLYLLHGGGGNGRDMLGNTRPLLEQLWDEERLPPVVVVAPSAVRSNYMDYRDRSQRWEQLLVGPFLSHVRGQYRVRQDREGLFVCGGSMGGLGALRLGFKHPGTFAGLAALEPGIEPALAFRDIEFEDRFHRSSELFESIYGKPVDEEYWAESNPANIALKDADTLRSSKLGIYLECGDEDSLGLDRGTEFLHRILRDNAVPHEYHLVRGADHVGRTLGPRMREALEFLGRLMSPPPPDPVAEEMRTAFAQLKEQARKTSEDS